MLFLNISTDNMVIEIEGKTILLERNDIEDTIGPELVKLHKEYNFSDIFLLNGPGGFTNLRVGTLSTNLLNTLNKGSINVYSITKIDFFKHFVDKGILPNKGIIYIGQKKNVRLYDFEKGDYSTIKKEDINYNDNLFFDLVYEDGYFKDGTIGINCKDDKIVLTYNGSNYETTITDLMIKPEKIVDAKYFIKPIMGDQGQ